MQRSRGGRLLTAMIPHARYCVYWRQLAWMHDDSLIPSSRRWRVKYMFRTRRAALRYARLTQRLAWGDERVYETQVRRLG